MDRVYDLLEIVVALGLIYVGPGFDIEDEAHPGQSVGGDLNKIVNVVLGKSIHINHFRMFELASAEEPKHVDFEWHRPQPSSRVHGPQESTCLSRTWTPSSR